MKLDTRRFGRLPEDGEECLVRIVGIINLGRQKKIQFGSRFLSSELIAVPQIVFKFEFVDPKYYIDAVTPLTTYSFMTVSTHESSKLYKLADAVDPSTIITYQEDVPFHSEEYEVLGDQRVVVEIDVPELTYGMIQVVVKRFSKNPSRFNVKDFSRVPDELQWLKSDMPVNTPYIHDIVTGKTLVGTKSQLPKGLIEHYKETRIL